MPTRWVPKQVRRVSQQRAWRPVALWWLVRGRRARVGMLVVVEAVEAAPRFVHPPAASPPRLVRAVEEEAAGDVVAREGKVEAWELLWWRCCLWRRAMPRSCRARLQLAKAGVEVRVVQEAQAVLGAKEASLWSLQSATP